MIAKILPSKTFCSLIERTLAVSLVLAAFLLCSGLTTFALSFNGTTSASGDGSSTTAATGGYAIPDMIANNSNRAVGYRFSVIDKTGAVKKAAYDVFRYKTRTTYSKNYSAYEKFSTKYAKTYLKSKYTTLKITTSTSTASCSHDTDWSLELPELTTGLKAWCTDARMKTILSKIWNITISTLETNRWAVLVEPIFPIKLESTYHSLTPTEIAVYGAARFGKSSNGNSSSNANSFGFIANYSNRYYPNALRLETTMAGMSAAANLTSRISFENIINKGYGCAILYSSYLSLPDQYYLDVNGLLDGTSKGTTDGYGTFDVYMDGKLVADDVIDFYTKYNSGTKYEIKDIKATAGHTYNGIASNSVALSGTLTAAKTVVLNFTTNTYNLDINGILNGKICDTIEDYGTVDVYIDGEQVADDVTDFKRAVKYGSTYTVTDIKSCDGSVYVGNVTDGIIGMTGLDGNPLTKAGDGLSGTVTSAKSVYLEFKVDKILEIVPIDANEKYKETTDVVTSCWLVNPSGYDFSPKDNLKVTFKVQNNGKEIYTETKQVIVPKEDKNLCYFKWSVPENLNGKSVTVTFTVFDESIEYYTVSQDYETAPYEYFTTPDTTFESKAPSNFQNVSAPLSQTGYATWWEYEYKDGEFIKQTYGLGIDAIAHENLILADPNFTESMKSGYGFRINSSMKISEVSGCLAPNASAYTNIQRIVARFPEFMYKSGNNYSKTLICNKDAGYFEFPQFKDYGKIHFVPIWFPDGDYTVTLEKTDFWTPAGVITSYVVCNPIKIDGNVYDDWYIQHK